LDYRGCLGFVKGSNDLSYVSTEALNWTTNGNVNVPNTLTAGTISATTYLNLPAVPASQLLPLTLNSITSHVGINQTTPTEALDVVGNAKVSGTVTADTVSASHYLNLPALVVDPLTLDAVNHKVGINQTTPTEALDVVGNAKVSGTVTADTVNASHYLNLPAPVVDPLTLDAVNHKVGINQSTPQFPLDVSGDCHVSDVLIADMGVETGELLANNAIIQQSLKLSGIAEAAKPTVLYYDQPTATVSYGDAPVSSVLPLTLDATNHRVGVNVTSPTEALDVDGNIQATGDLVVDGEVYLQGLLSESKSNILYYDFITKKISFASPPSTNLLPITLDKTNNRVGINQTTPQFPLDVSGDCHVSDVLIADMGVETGELLANNAIIQQSLKLSGIAEAAKSNILYYDFITKKISFASPPSTNLLPITLDKTNNRVGINQTTPTQPLDVDGAIQSTKLIVNGTLANKGLIYTDITNNRVGIGSITPTTTLDVTGTTTTQNLNLSAIPSATKTNVLYYDTSTKAVSYGAAPSGGTSTIVKAFPSTNFTTVSTLNTIENIPAATISLTEGKWLITLYVRYTASASANRLELGLSASSLAMYTNSSTNFTLFSIDSENNFGTPSQKSFTHIVENLVPQDYYFNTRKVSGTGTFTLQGSATGLKAIKIG
jgi:hypothetical protein